MDYSFQVEVAPSFGGVPVKPETLKATPFHFAYPPDLETEWIDVMDYGVPLWVSDPEDEYDAFRNRVGLLEYSMLYRWDIQGQGAVATVDAVFSRNVAKLAPGTMAYGVIVDADGNMVDDPTVTVYGPEHVLLVGGNPDVGQILNEHLVDNARVHERRSECCVLSVQGPQSRALLSRLVDTDMSNDAFPYYTFRTGVTLAGVVCQINRIGFTAELGFEVVAPIDAAPHLLAAVQEAGADLGATLCGAAALMMCRIESGMVMAGLEYDETSSPFDCRLGWAVDFDKGSFVGRDALLSLRDTAPDRVITLEVDGDADGLDGVPLLHDSNTVGAITMAVPSPALGGSTIAMARIQRALAEPGTKLEVAAPDGHRRATVLRTPVYDPDRTRVRS